MNPKWRVLAAVALFFGGVLVGYFVGHVPRLDPFRNQERTQQEPSGTKLGTWETTFKPPGSVRLPDANPVVTFEFGKVDQFVYDRLTVTITNMTASTYTLSYTIFGYDSKGRRVSESEAAFQIGGHESVIREIRMETYGVRPRTASSFLLAASAEQ